MSRARSVRLAFALAACVVLAASPVSAAHGTPRAPRLRAVHDWALAIGDGCLKGDIVRRYGRFDLVVLDGEGARARDVRHLHRHGTLVLAYLSVGTIEGGRWWYPQVRDHRLEWWGDWGEWYADVSSADYRRSIQSTVTPWMLGKGFDGLFLDNTDMVEGHTTQTAGMRSLVRVLSRVVRKRHLLLFTQNGEDSIGPVLRYYDGWNREDVSWTYSFERRHYERVPAADRRAAQAALRRFGRARLLTLSTDYTRIPTGRAVTESLRNARAAGALPFISDIGLDRIPWRPYR